MAFASFAPAKIILFGEHYVVYGAPAVAIPIEPRNKVIFGKRRQEGIALASELGIGRISKNGEYEGAPELEMYAHVARKLLGKRKIPSCTAKFAPALRLKGIGTSSSLCAAFAAGLCRLAGKKATKKEIYEAVQAGDLVAHGKKASGIDAAVVSYGVPLIFKKDAAGAISWQKIKIRLPAGFCFLLIDTYEGKRESTADLIEKFGKSFDEKVRLEEYLELWGKIKDAFGDAKKLGELMLQNHYLLKERGVSSAGIEKAIEAALKAGAFGAKITGAGGEGGVVVALVKKNEASAVAESIMKDSGFASVAVRLFAS
ncbi:MAG: mevalonate kinase [Candidatus Micrarchaeota archaeon]|nr:mevalonate kinase [Candidatus Micrarchaeota archaeon]